MKFDESSLSHTTWECKYHVVFAPKFRRRIIYGKIKKDIGVIIRSLCERKGVELLEGEACSDHVHILISVPPKISISSFMGYLKGKSTLMICQCAFYFYTVRFRIMVSVNGQPLGKP